MLQEVPIIQSKTQEDGVTTRPIPHTKSYATNRLLEGAPCSACTARIRQGDRRLVCWSCKAQYQFSCMKSNRTQIVGTQTTQRGKCINCSQKPVADSQNNKMVPILDKKSPGEHQHQLRILQWSANGIPTYYHFWKISLKLQMWTWLAFTRRSCSQKTRLLNSDISLLSDVIEQYRGK